MRPCGPRGYAALVPLPAGAELDEEPPDEERADGEPPDEEPPDVPAPFEEDDDVEDDEDGEEAEAGSFFVSAASFLVSESAPLPARESLR